MIRAFNLLMLVVGAIALVFVVEHLGREGLEQAVVGTGAWFAVIGLIDLCGAMCDSQAIRHFMRADADVSFGRVFVAQISGMAINRLTPGRTLGEPVKITTLMRWVPGDVAVPAIVRFSLYTMYVSTAAIVVGVPLAVATLDLPHQVELAVEIGVGGLVALAVGIAYLVRRGAFRTVLAALVRVRILSIERGERWTRAIAEVDARLRTPGATAKTGVLFVLASRCFNWLGTVVVLHAAGIELSPPLVIATLSVGSLVTYISQVVPLGLGLADGSNYVLYGLLGASPGAGLLFTMIDRLRTILIAVCGLTVMGVTRALRSSRRDRPGSASPTATDR